MKAVIAIILVLLLALLGIGGYYVYQQTAGAPPANSTPATPSPQIGTLAQPETEYDVQDALSAAITANKDTVAWLEVPGTEINGSVVQSIDNNYYLRRNETKQYDVYGCYFADYECAIGAPEVLRPNTVIYGHSNTDKDSDPTQPRFSQLFSFLDAEFAKKTPYIYMTTPDGKTTWEVFAAFYTTTQFDYIGVHISTQQMLQIGKKAKSLSELRYDIPLDQDTKLLTLSTCSYKFQQDGTGRYVVMARLVPEGEALVKEARLQ